MKNYIAIIVSLLWRTTYAQTTSITIQDNTINGREHSSGWIFENETDSIVALEKSTYQLLIKKYKQLEAQVKRHEEIIKAKDELIAAFENYEKKADVHIHTQDSLLNIADTLYHGYKGLYKDLKSIVDIKTYSVLLGAGVNKYDQNNPGYLFDAGIEYNKIQLSYQFGNNYSGLILRYRIPLF
jgi:hypothetical protein